MKSKLFFITVVTTVVMSMTVLGMKLPSLASLGKPKPRPRAILDHKNHKLQQVKQTDVSDSGVPASILSTITPPAADRAIFPSEVVAHSFLLHVASTARSPPLS
jgi:hypothetical protein